jgi:peroxiredoxin Q/BCP
MPQIQIMETKLQVGEKLPQFSLEDQNGNIVTNNSLMGQKYIIFFYPKDDSPGCTKQACSIRDNFRAISAQGYKVFGVSPDNVKKHNKFINKYEFQYDLLADPDKKMINDFGVIGPKKFMGREIIGVYRTSFFVDENGKIEHIIDKVKTKDHGLQILDYLSDVQ